MTTVLWIKSFVLEVGCDTLGTDSLSPFKKTLLCLVRRSPWCPQVPPYPSTWRTRDWTSPATHNPQR
ncbi:unnamed protein product [Boreogadus saida]